MEDMYRGKIIPELIDKDGQFICDNSFCHEINCLKCIHFPTLEVNRIRENYVKEMKDERKYIR